MTAPVPKLCVVVTTPLIVHFFLKPHLVALSRHFDVTLVCNPAHDGYLPPLDVPARQVAIGIERKIRLVRDLAALVQLYRLFRREKFDLVVSAAPKAGLLGMVAAALAGIRRRLHIFQGEVWASRRGVMRALLKTMDRIMAGAATHVLAVGQGERNFLETEGIARPGVITVLGAGSIAGVDMRRFRHDAEMRRAFRAEHGIPDDAVVALFLGRLTLDKGLRELARAFARCGSDSSLWLVVAGPDEAGLAAELAALAGGGAAARVLVHGFTATPERYIAAADILCLPSYREGFPMVILEAAAASVPSIGTSIYAIRDAVIDGETGLLVPVGSVTELAAALSRLAADAPLRQRLGEAARMRVERDYAQETVVARYVDYCRDVVKAVGPDGPTGR